jgi:hypothetical protein
MPGFPGPAKGQENTAARAPRPYGPEQLRERALGLDYEYVLIDHLQGQGPVRRPTGFAKHR